jgi:hypothetical protein
MNRQTVSEEPLTKLQLFSQQLLPMSIFQTVFAHLHYIRNKKGRIIVRGMIWDFVLVSILKVTTTNPSCDVVSMIVGSFQNQKTSNKTGI